MIKTADTIPIITAIVGERPSAKGFFNPKMVNSAIPMVSNKTAYIGVLTYKI